MYEAIKLYYDWKKNYFSLSPSDGSIEVFQSHNRIGYEKGKDTISIDPFRIEITTNFYPQSPAREYIFVDIYINNVLLLPLSLACRKAAVHYHLGEHEIAFTQWGPGQNYGKAAHTIMQKKDKICWDNILLKICEICNDYNKWIENETATLIQSLLIHKKESYHDIATFIELVRRYDTIAPNIIPLYRIFVDDHCFHAMTQLVDSINNSILNELNKKYKASYGDIIWKYIKDYYLDVVALKI